MQVVVFAAYLVVTYFTVLQVFRFTTYHAYFWKALPILLAYSLLVGYGLHVIGLDGLLAAHVVFNSWWLFLKGRGQRKKILAALEVISDPEQRKLIEWSGRKTIQYFTASAITYVVVSSASNRWWFGG